MLNIEDDIDAEFFVDTIDDWDITYDELDLAVDRMYRRLKKENAMTVERGIGAPTRGLASLWRRLKPRDPDAGARKINK
jgi:hypothetical protein